MEIPKDALYLVTLTAPAGLASGSLAMLERWASSRVSSFGRSARAALFLSK